MAGLDAGDRLGDTEDAGEDAGLGDRETAGEVEGLVEGLGLRLPLGFLDATLPLAADEALA